MTYYYYLVDSRALDGGVVEVFLSLLYEYCVNINIMKYYLVNSRALDGGVVEAFPTAELRIRHSFGQLLYYASNVLENVAQIYNGYTQSEDPLKRFGRFKNAFDFVRRQTSRSDWLSTLLKTNRFSQFCHYSCFPSFASQRYIGSNIVFDVTNTSLGKSRYHYSTHLRASKTLQHEFSEITHAEKGFQEKSWTIS